LAIKKNGFGKSMRVKVLWFSSGFVDNETKDGQKMGKNLPHYKANVPPLLNISASLLAAIKEARTYEKRLNIVDGSCTRRRVPQHGNIKRSIPI
jgi:hypothetical protein